MPEFVLACLRLRTSSPQSCTNDHRVLHHAIANEPPLLRAIPARQNPSEATELVSFEASQCTDGPDLTQAGCDRTDKQEIHDTAPPVQHTSEAVCTDISPCSSVPLQRPNKTPNYLPSFAMCLQCAAKAYPTLRAFYQHLVFIDLPQIICIMTRETMRTTWR